MNTNRKSPSKKLKVSSTSKLTPNSNSSPSNRSKVSTPTKSVSYKSNLLNISKSRLKLTQDLDTYTLLIRSRNPIRCLQHNSNISIYCQTEQRLLCANCIFGRTEHKFHRVTPVDKSLSKIQRDVETMNRLIDRQLQTMQLTEQKLTKSLVQQQNDTHDCLKQLVKVYQQCHRQLQMGFLAAKTIIINKIQQIRHKYDQIMHQVKMQSQNYKISGMAKSLSKQHFNDQQLLLYEHSICSVIISQKKFQQKNLNFGKRQIFNIASEQKRKIISVFQLINRLFQNR